MTLSNKICNASKKRVQGRAKWSMMQGLGANLSSNSHWISSTEAKLIFCFHSVQSQDSVNGQHISGSVFLSIYQLGGGTTTVWHGYWSQPTSFITSSTVPTELFAAPSPHPFPRSLPCSHSCSLTLKTNFLPWCVEH